MILLTLDTNALRDIGWVLGLIEGERYHGNPDRQAGAKSAYEKILKMRDKGEVELGVTTQIYSDFRETRTELPEDVEMLIGEHVNIATPSVFKFPLAFPAAFADPEEYEHLFSEVFPHSQPDHKAYERNRLDAWQLYAHQVAQRDFFITSDEGILSKHAVLHDGWSIEVRSPSEFIEEFAE